PGCTVPAPPPHSQAASPSGSTQSATRTSSGACNAPSWVSSARSSARAAARSPVTRISAKPGRNSATGWSGRVLYARMKRRSAFAATGSRSSTGLVCIGAIRTASRCSPVPTRISRKSGWVGRRSQRRVVIASDHSDAGSGCRHRLESRWSWANRRTRRRCWAR
ncbi:hypothetical protein, partial [Micromonospora humida]|uniref:hypothetical protein n=1 Tax=Micromonospora humida TaxID=2809018 RepID=UPI003F4D76BC